VAEELPTGEEIDEALEDLRFLGLIERRDNKILIDRGRTIEYLSVCFNSFKRYMSMVGKLESFRSLFRMKPEVALTVAIGSCLMADAAIARRDRLEAPMEEALFFERRYAETLTMIFIHLLRDTPLYATALAMLEEVLADPKD